MSGVVLFRFPMTPLSGEQMANVIHSRNDWMGKFSVVTEDRIRMRPLNDPY